MSVDSKARPWRGRRIVGIGEAMLEFAAVGDNLYRRGFAGDTLNTCWHMRQLLGERAEVAYATRVGLDAFSDELVGFVASNGMDASLIGRDTERTLGLYVISLTGAERSFSYWRETSAARRLADDRGALRAALEGVALVHVSGITLGVIGEAGRANLFAALAEARGAGVIVSFDPNARPRLWRGADEMREAKLQMFRLADIVLPSFDDEAMLWGDAAPEATLDRLETIGVGEIVVKNGAGEVALSLSRERARIATPRVPLVRDTTGAGDGFNAGYLAARWVGMDAEAAVAIAQAVAAEVIQHHGALTPKERLTATAETLRAFAGEA